MLTRRAEVALIWNKLSPEYELRATALAELALLPGAMDDINASWKLPADVITADKLRC